MARNGYTNRFLSFTMMILLLVSTLAFLKLVSPAQANPDPIEGWAVIVTGDYGGGAWLNGSEAAYDALNSSGYSDYHINYLDAAYNPHMDNLSTLANVEYAIKDWLHQKSDADDICVIFLHDHGSDSDFFYVNNQTEELYYSNVSDWIDNINYGRLIIVVDACYSGMAINDLSGENRIIISSAKSSEETGIGIFAENFWPKTVDNNIMDAFNEAASESWNETQLDYKQQAQLDDNGDGVGHWKPDDPLPLGGDFYDPDGYLANVRYLNKNNMADLVVEAKGIKAAGGVETLAGVNVALTQHINRSTTVNILLAKGDYTIEVPNSTVINGTMEVINTAWMRYGIYRESIGTHSIMIQYE